MAALPVSKPFIVRGSGGSVAARIIIDFSGQGRDCTMVGVVGNFSDQATAALYYGSNSDPNGKFGDLHINRGSAFLVFSEVGSTTLNSEHFSIRINDDVDTGVYGYAILATHEETPAGLAQSWSQNVRKRIRAVPNELGVPMIGRKVTEAYETSVSFEGMTEGERHDLDAWLHALEGPINPLFMIAPDHNEALFGRLASNDYQITHQGSYYDFNNIVFRSDPVGTIVTA